MICNISDGQPRGNYAKPAIEGSKLPQKCLKGRIAYASFLWPGRVLQWLQAVQNQQGPMMGDKLRQSFTLLPRRSDARIRISKPGESSVNKFICRRRASTGALSVKGPAKDELRRAILFSSYPREPMVDERGLSDAGP